MSSAQDHDLPQVFHVLADTKSYIDGSVYTEMSNWPRTEMLVGSVVPKRPTFAGADMRSDGCLES